MCVLSACLQQTLNECYRYDEGKFLEEVLQQKLQLLTGYSRGLVNSLVQMTSRNEDSRPDFLQLVSLVQ